jgi:hypothetical protein
VRGREQEQEGRVDVAAESPEWGMKETRIAGRVDGPVGGEKARKARENAGG